MTESDKTLRDEVVELADRIHRLSESTGIIERAAAHEYAVRQLRGILARHPVAHPADMIPWDANPDMMWAAKDPTGAVCMYDAEPHCDPQFNGLIDQWWQHELEGMKWARVKGIIHGPWRDSLRKRPEGV